MDLYERVGKEAGIDAVVDEFYKLVLQDDLVKGFFAKTDMKMQARKQKQFFNHVLGGKNYYGKNMKVAHKGMGVRDVHFNRIAELLAKAMSNLGVKDKEIQEVLAIVATTHDDICENPVIEWNLQAVAIAVGLAAVGGFIFYKYYK
ncbi:hypothetical protein HK103_000333 [Boothiomyces macroporosus]|uniref:Globin n=1 Tax=Boothiomyces macroporosus TaxID=261099 RepID=A0AAD5UBK6_9FUNG|nr:hypothetical protein HK103_000333 [Boothiomyces macroporosus]